MSLDTTIPGGIYQSVDGSYHDAWGNKVADPNGPATVTEIVDETNTLTIETSEGEIEVKAVIEDANADGTITIEEPDGEIVKLDAPAKKGKKVAV
jgi:hypothetical protein